MKNVALTIVIFWVLSSQVVAGESLPIFEKGKDVLVSWSKCGNSTAIQRIRVDAEEGRINWKWDDKENTWCVWATQTLPLSDLTEYLNGELILEFVGSYVGEPPTVKFLDYKDRPSIMLSFEGQTDERDKARRKRFMSGEPITGAVVKIPLREFFGTDPDFYPAAPDRIKALQFDPGFSSKRGKITITSIRLEKR